MRIFLSYRRQDTQHAAGRLADRLTRKFGKDNIFVDVTSLPPGIDYHAHITRAVNRCDVLLAIIGPGWMDARTAAGTRRLDDENDLMRLEIVAGLERDIPVIPVLVDNAPELHADQLPPPLRALAGRQAVHLSHTSFDADTDHLITSLTSGHRSRRRTVIAVASGVAAIAAAVAVAAALTTATPPGPATPTPTASKPAAGCTYSANGTTVVAPRVTSAGEQTALTFCPVRINGGNLPIKGPFELAGQVLGDSAIRKNIILWNQTTPGTCDANGDAPGIRGEFVIDRADVGSADGKWSYIDPLGYPEAVTFARQFELITADPPALQSIRDYRAMWGRLPGHNPSDYPGIAAQDIPPHTVLATFDVPAGVFPGAKPCH